MGLTSDLRQVSEAFKADVTGVFKGHRQDAEAAVRAGNDAVRAFGKARDAVHALLEGKRFNSRPVPAENLKLNLKSMAAAISKADKDIPDTARFEKFMLKFDRLERAAPKKEWRAIDVSKKAKHARAIDEFTEAMEKYAQKVRTNRNLKDAWKAFQKKTHWKAFATAEWASNKIAIQKARGDFAHYANALAAVAARHTITIADLNQIRSQLKAMKSNHHLAMEASGKLSAISLDLYNIDSIVLSQIGRDLGAQLEAAANTKDADQAEAQKLHSAYKAFVASYVRDSEATREMEFALDFEGMELAYLELLGTSPATPPMQRIDEAGRIRSTHRLGGGGGGPEPTSDLAERTRRRDDRHFDREIFSPYRAKRRSLGLLLGGLMDISKSPHRRYLTDTNGDGAVLAPFDSFITNVRDCGRALQIASEGAWEAIEAATNEERPKQRSDAQVEAFNAYEDFLDTLEQVEGELSQLAVSLRAQQAQAAARDQPEELVENYGAFVRYVERCQEEVNAIR